MEVIGAFRGATVPQFRELPELDPPLAGQLVLRTLELGICGTDREILASAEPVLPPGSDFLGLGHECLAEVIESNSAGSPFAIGDWVVPMVRRPFPGLARRPDMLALGQFTERGILHEHGFSAPYFLDRPEYLLGAPRALRSLAVLTEPLAVVEKGVREAEQLQRARLGDTAWPRSVPRVLVTGQGPIAFAGILACGARGWPVTVYGRDAREAPRAVLAIELGASYVSDAEWSAEPADVEADGFDLILECTGSDEVLARTAPALASCGVMVWLGSSRLPEAKVHDLDRIMRNALIRNHLHLGSVNAARCDFEEALTHLGWWHTRAADRVSRIITDRVPFRDSLWHFTHRRPQGIKCVVEYTSLNPRA